MKHYYIQINGQQSAPLTFEELRAHHITLDTLVWFEGMDHWTKAGNIPELAVLFRTTPPPIQREVTPATAPVYPTIQQSLGIGTLRKALVGGFMIIVVSVLVFSFANDEQATMQSQTELNARQLQEQQVLIEEQNAKIAEQEKIEHDRKIVEITKELNTAIQKVERAKQGVNDATAFELLRSKNRRNEEINAANKVLESWEGEVERLEGELARLNE